MLNQDPNPMEAIGKVPVCSQCQSERVLRDAQACWNTQSGLWELSAVLDHAVCQVCKGDTTLNWVAPEDPPIEATRTLNDMLRCHGRGNGQIVVTQGVQAEGETFLRSALTKMREFDAFSPDNDVYGEHDFGAFDIEGQKLFFKIDYYDPTLTYGSENPANPEKTVRVLTLMLANEY